MFPNKDYYDEQTTANILGFGDNTDLLQDLYIQGLIPSAPLEDNVPGLRFLPTYVDGLAAKLDLAVSHGSPRLDPILMGLWYFRHLYEKKHAYTPKTRRDRYTALIGGRCLRFAHENDVVDLQSLFALLADHFSQVTIEKWSTEGRIATVHVGRSRYASRVYCEALVRLITEYRPLTDAAEQVGVRSSWLWRMAVKRGEIKTLTGPDGAMRMSPGDIAMLRARYRPGDQCVTLEEFLQRLRAVRKTVHSALESGRIQRVETGGRRILIPYSELLKWETRFTALNPEFEWLQHSLTSPWDTPICSAQDAARQLGIYDKTLRAWSLNGLLPFYVRTFDAKDGEDGGYVARSFVSSYITGLAEYAGSGKVRRSHTRAYKQICVEAGMIVEVIRGQ